MPYLGRGPGFGIRQKYFYTASADDTSVSGSDDNNLTLTFTDGLFIDVYLNGVLLDPNSDYNTTTANTVAGLAALSANDFVEIVAYESFSIGDVVPASSGGTFSGAITSNGDITATGTLFAQGDTAAGDDAAIGYTAAEGLILTGQGSTNDVTIKNDADQKVMSVPTGTRQVHIGDASANDVAMVFDGNAQDFYVGLDDSADDLVIGLGSAVGTTPAISIDENVLVTVADDVSVVGRAFSPTLTTNLGSAIDLSLGNNFLITTTGDVVLTFTNQIAGQSGTMKFVNDSDRAVTAHTNVAISEADLATISKTGTYMVSYFVSASSAANTILVSASAILT